MPTFDFTAPDGKSYSVDGPDGATPEQAFGILQQHIGAPSVGMGEDIAKGAGAGLASAAIGTLGSVGDIRDLASRGVDAIAPKLGIDPATVKNAANAASYALPGGRLVAGAPNSQDIKSTVTDPIVSPDYQPQTFAGKVTKTGAEFLPAMVGGPESLAAKFATRVAVPALASETAGALTNDNPWAKVGGALLGAGGASKIGSAFNEAMLARKAASALPSGEDILKSGSKGFEAVKASDAIIKPSSVEQMAKDIKTEMLNEGKHPTSEGQAGVFSALDRLEALGQSGGGVTTKDMEVIRRSLSDLKTNPVAGATARMATDKFMEKYSNLGTPDLLHGTNPFPTLKNAIGDWAAAKNLQTLQGKRNLAELNANSPVGGLDAAVGGQALQRTMKQLARPVNNTDMPVARKLGFKTDEVVAITRAANGNAPQHIAEVLDRVVPAKLGAIPAMILRQIGGLSTKKQVAAVDSLVRSRSPHAQQVAAQLPPQIINQLPAKTQRLLQTLAAVAVPAIRQQIAP